MLLDVLASPKKHHLSPDSSLSDAPPPSPKRRRTSASDSSLSEAEENSDEEDQPLAARMPRAAKTGPPKRQENGIRRAGKKTGGKGISMTSLPAEQAHSAAEGAAKMTGRANGQMNHEAKVKFEDKLDDRQLSRLATGVTVDSGVAAPTPVRDSYRGASFMLLNLRFSGYSSSRKGRLC